VIGIDAWSRFSSSSQVESLLLRHTRLSDASFSSIARMHRLRFLGIIDSTITDNGLLPLANNNRLEELRLTETLVTDEGLAHLKSMAGLKWLDLYNTAVTAAGVSALQAARPDLEIRYDWEAPDLADLKTKISGVKAGKSTYLAVAGWKIQDRHLSELGELTGIESLALNAHHLTDATLARVKSLSRLKELDVSSSRISAHGLRDLVVLPQLRMLTLDERQIDQEAIDALRELRAPMEVWIKHDLDDADLKQLEARLNLRLPREGGVKLHFDRRSNSSSTWD
jgi:hypothetical protein